MPHSGVQLKIDRGDGVTVFCGSTDIGQGSDFVLAYIVAEELGVTVDDVSVVSADTNLTPVDLGSYSSRVTLMTGNAAIEVELAEGAAAGKITRIIGQSINSSLSLKAVITVVARGTLLRFELKAQRFHVTR